MDENISDEEIYIGYEEYSDDNINETTHGKPVDNLAKMHFNSETEIDSSAGSETDNSSKHEARDD